MERMLEAVWEWSVVLVVLVQGLVLWAVVVWGVTSVWEVLEQLNNMIWEWNEH